MILNDLERQLMLWCQCYGYCDQMAEVSITGISL